jgi:hypothetical protein
MDIKDYYYLFGQGASKNPGGAKTFSGPQHFKSPPFFGKNIFRTITLQLLS